MLKTEEEDMINTHYRSRSLLAVGAGVLLSLAAPLAQAQQFPSKPIHFVHPFAGGSASDTIYRPVMDKLSIALGVPILVEPRPGGGGLVSALHVKSQPPDGYTIYMASNTLTSRSVEPNAQIDSRKDFTAIVPAAASTIALAVNTDQIKATTLKDFIEEVRAKPGQFNYSSYGVGSSSNVAMELLLYEGKIKMVHVPFNGSAPAVLDTAAGRTQATITITSTLKPFVASLGGSGKLRMLVVTTAERSPLLPDVPGMRESGFPQIDYPVWSAFVGPAGMPRPIVDKLNKEVTGVYHDPQILEGLPKFGQVPMYGSPDDVAKLIARDYDNVSKLVKEAGLKLE
jgi:tripartite-type tricarboxylate transporter receptor subunit TctC